MAPRFAKHQSFDCSQFVVTRDFGALGLESVMHPEATMNSVAFDIVAGQIDRVVSVVEFNVVEGWARDITDDIRDAVRGKREVAA